MLLQLQTMQWGWKITPMYFWSMLCGCHAPPEEKKKKIPSFLWAERQAFGETVSCLGETGSVQARIYFQDSQIINTDCLSCITLRYINTITLEKILNMFQLLHCIMKRSAEAECCRTHLLINQVQIHAALLKGKVLGEQLQINPHPGCSILNVTSWICYCWHFNGRHLGSLQALLTGSLDWDNRTVIVLV